MQQNTTTKEEILKVAMDIFPNETFTEEEIQKVIEFYPNQAEGDPTGYWVVWIEDILYQIIDCREIGGLY